VCSEARVLISTKVKDAVSSDEFFKDAAFEEHHESHDSFWSVSGIPLVAPELGLLLLAKRHTLQPNELAVLDKQIKADDLVEKTVMMFNLDLSEWAGESLGEVMTSKHKAIDLIRPVLEKHGGIGLETMLWLFTDPVEAALATLEVRRAVEDANKVNTEQIQITGYGIHTGDVLFIQGTDIHWGDPVNTSSKLGQDLAEGSDILVMPGIKEVVEKDSRCSKLSFQKKMLSRSNVDFECYSIDDEIR